MDTTVVLTVDRDGELVDLPLVRAEVVVPNVRHRVLPGNVGYVEIDHFSQRTVENLVRSMKALDERGALEYGLVIDLRGNTGGSMREAARSADQFLTKGMLLRTAGADGGRVQNLQGRMEAEDRDNEPEIPVVLLVDGRTASGSEILAGALMALDRAVLVGSRTYGKGTVQKIYSIADDARLKLTVAPVPAARGSLDLRRGPPARRGPRRHRPRRERRPPAWLERHPDQCRPRGPGRGRAGGLAGQGRRERGRPAGARRRAVLRAKGHSRDDVLAALATVADEVRAEQDARLVEAFAGSGHRLVGVRPGGSIPDVDVVLRTVTDPSTEGLVVVEIEVENLGDRPLHRAFVELECGTFGPWDGVVVPLGRIPPGERLTGKASVSIDPGVVLREDPVTAWLMADGRNRLRVGEEVLRAESERVPEIAIAARLVGDGSVRQAEVVVTSLADETITGVEVYFSHPGDVGVELIDRAARLPILGPHDDGRIDLAVQLGGESPTSVPLELVIEAERFGRLVEWGLDLPADGSVVTLQAPTSRPGRRSRRL